MNRLLYLLVLGGILVLTTACGKSASDIASGSVGNAMQIPNVNCGDDPCI